MNENDALRQYESLRSQCLENPVFKAILLQVEQDIISGIKDSPDSAVNAHHEYKALQRLLGKVKALTFSAEQQKQILSKPQDESDY